MSLLLDTDICSAYLKGNPKVGHRFIQHGGRIHLSVITAAELTVWISRASASPKRRAAVVALLKGVALLDVTPDVASKFGEIRAGQLDQGTFTLDLDLLIASTAIMHGFTLVTHNVQDFSNVPGLSIDDWLTP
ncbi:MAG: type II toxin-antitoxin system VapC family toxin [Planctomycetia bacterium]|nr:type II toxin-antitoxin system VapC family toxin [Planctomycetia bacterium]